MNRENFTKRYIDNINPTKKRAYYYDAKQKGLRISVTPKGTKTYQFQARGGKHGKPINETIARYGDISISEARKRAAELLSRVKQGQDPAAEKAEQRAEKTLNEIFPSYLNNYAKLRKKTWAEDERQFKNYFQKSIGRKKPSEISKKTVQTWMGNLADKSGTVTANRAYALLSVIFNTQLEHLENPCKNIKKYSEVSRDRFLKPDELKRFFTALNTEKQIYIDFFSLLLLTGARKSNVLSMRWDQINEGLWIIPNTASKNKKEIILPLVNRAIDILQSRRKNSEYVFPGRAGHLKDPKKAWQRILAKAELKNVTMHDLRRTFGSYQAMAGANLAVIGASLGHRDLQSTQIYARLQTEAVKQSSETATDIIFGDSEEK